jgi:hypothetical protein
MNQRLWHHAFSVEPVRTSKAPEGDWMSVVCTLTRNDLKACGISALFLWSLCERISGLRRQIQFVFKGRSARTREKRSKF